MLARHAAWVRSVEARSIDSFSPADAEALKSVFVDFEKVLGPVGAAKALHLLAPDFLPLWDRAIAVAYGLELGPAGSNGARYVRLAYIARVQAARINGHTTPGRGALKAIDEYNYCRFTKGWM